MKIRIIRWYNLWSNETNSPDGAAWKKCKFCRGPTWQTEGPFSVWLRSILRRLHRSWLLFPSFCSVISQYGRLEKTLH